MRVDTYITVKDYAGVPSAKLVDKVTLGSEIGDILIEEAKVSPRHCSFIKNNDVIMLIDHSSIDGTYINKKKIDAGRTYIVSESDRIKIGGLTVAVEMMESPESTTTALGRSFEDKLSELDSMEDATSSVTNLEKTGEFQNLVLESSFEEESVPNESPPSFNDDYVEDDHFGDDKVEGEAFEEMTSPGLVMPEIDVEEVDLDPLVLPKKYTLGKGPKAAKEKRKKGKLTKATDKKKEKKKTTAPAANFVFRAFANLFDILVCLTILNIFYVYIDFKNFYHELPHIFGVIFSPLYEMTLAPFVTDFIATSSEQQKNYDEFIHLLEVNKVGMFASFLICFKLGSSLLFGTTLGQFLIGIRPSRRFIEARLLGPIRELVGIVLFPFFFMTELPTMFSKRSFKELITRTRVYTHYYLFSCFFTVVMTVALSLAFALSPLVKGLEIQKPVNIIDKKFEVVPWEYSNRVYSSLFKMQYDLNDKVTTLPSFNFVVKNKKRYLNFGLIFWNIENGLNIEVVKKKEFKMSSLYSHFVKLNFLSQYFQPKIYGEVRNIAKTNDNFKKDEKFSAAVVAETKKVVRDIFSLTPESLSTFLKENGPLIAGHRDFREKIESLLEEKIVSIQFPRLGQSDGFLFEHRKAGDSFYTFIPLDVNQSKVYYFSDKFVDERFKLMNQSIVWGESSEANKRDPISEFMQGFKGAADFEDPTLEQMVYERYFRVGKSLLEISDLAAIDKLVLNIENTLQVLSANPKTNKKLFLNLTELKESLVNKDKKFFNIRSIVSL